jgi:hypothetical protein
MTALPEILPYANKREDRNLPEIAETFDESLQALGTDGEPQSKPSFVP